MEKNIKCNDIDYLSELLVKRMGVLNRADKQYIKDGKLFAFNPQVWAVKGDDDDFKKIEEYYNSVKYCLFYTDYSFFNQTNYERNKIFIDAFNNDKKRVLDAKIAEEKERSQNANQTDPSSNPNSVQRSSTQRITNTNNQTLQNINNFRQKESEQSNVAQLNMAVQRGHGQHGQKQSQQDKSPSHK